MPPLVWLTFPVLAGAGFLFLSWVAYLAFCAWIVRRTGGTKALHDVAAAAGAFRGFARSRSLPQWRRPEARCRHPVSEVNDDNYVKNA